jgi:hypothetical protein
VSEGGDEGSQLFPVDSSAFGIPLKPLYLQRFRRWGRCRRWRTNHGIVEVLSGAAVAICVVRHGAAGGGATGRQTPTTNVTLITLFTPTMTSRFRLSPARLFLVPSPNLLTWFSSGPTSTRGSIVERSVSGWVGIGRLLGWPQSVKEPLGKERGWVPRSATSQPK